MPTNFVIGQALMLIAAKRVSAEAWPIETSGPTAGGPMAGRAGPASVPKILTAPLKLLLGYSAFIFVPVTTWYFYNHPAWSTVYLRAEETIAWWWGPIIVSQYFIGMLFGALLAQCLIQLAHQRVVYITLALSVFWLVGIWGFTLDQYLHIGTYAQYQLGAAQDVLGDFGFQKELNIMGATLFIPVAALAFYFSRKPKPMK